MGKRNRFKSVLVQLSLLLLLLLTKNGQSQTIPAGSKKLAEAELTTLLPDSVQKRLGIKHQLYAVFEFNDQSKKQWLVLSERVYKEKTGEKLNDSVQAMLLIKDKQVLKSTVVVNDFISPGVHKNGFTDYSIWFWTKYINLSDIDGDGNADPIIVYGTAADNNKDDGKIRIIVCYKNKKYVIRHQNGTLDYERNTRVDKAYYTLPVTIQTFVKRMMDKMTTDNNAIFPAGWEKAMKAKKTFFDEN
jgi:hypothetical protein